MGDGAWNEVELSTGRQNFEGGLGLVGAPGVCISIVFMARKAFIKDKDRGNPVTYLSSYEDSKEKLITIAKLVSWGRRTR